jgi:hypothetical protein
MSIRASLLIGLAAFALTSIAILGAYWSGIAVA